MVYIQSCDYALILWAKNNIISKSHTTHMGYFTWHKLVGFLVFQLLCAQQTNFVSMERITLGFGLYIYEGSHYKLETYSVFCDSGGLNAGAKMFDWITFKACLSFEAVFRATRMQCSVSWHIKWNSLL